MLLHLKEITQRAFGNSVRPEPPGWLVRSGFAPDADDNQPSQRPGSSDEACWARCSAAAISRATQRWPLLVPSVQQLAKVGMALLGSDAFFEGRKNLAFLNGKSQLRATFDPTVMLVMMRTEDLGTDGAADGLYVQALPGDVNPLLGTGSTAHTVSDVLWLTGLHHPESVGQFSHNLGLHSVRLRRMPRVSHGLMNHWHTTLIRLLLERAWGVDQLFLHAKMPDPDFASALCALMLTRSLKFS